MITASAISIPSGIACVLTFLGQHDTLSFKWLTPYAPYAYAFFASGMLLWLVYLILDYADVRRAAFAKMENNDKPSTNYITLIQTEKDERNQAIGDAIHGVRQQVNAEVDRINAALNELAKPKPEPNLEERTRQLSQDLFALLNRLGAEPPHALSDKSGTVAGQKQTFDAYFEWQKNAYYNYMAYFRNRVIQIDYELAASKIFTRLDDREIDPPKQNGEVNIRKIAETLLLTAEAVHSKHVRQLV